MVTEGGSATANRIRKSFVHYQWNRKVRTEISAYSVTARGRKDEQLRPARAIKLEHVGGEISGTLHCVYGAEILSPGKI